MSFPIADVLNSRIGEWQRQKKDWLALGLQSELGRKGNFYGQVNSNSKGARPLANSGYRISVFDPVLSQIVYENLCPKGGHILDPFTGGSVRGIVAAMLGYRYTGIELREEQIEENRRQATKIVDDPAKRPQWIIGDSRQELEKLPRNEFDLVFSCPPYFNLERYSTNKPGELSAMRWHGFAVHYSEIIRQSVSKLKPDRYACFVVGNVEDEHGISRGLPDLTCRAFQEAGAEFVRESRFYTPIGANAWRAERLWKTSRQIIPRPCQFVLFFRRRPARRSSNWEQVALFDVSQLPRITSAQPAVDS
jgi:hypothetical protein